MTWETLELLTIVADYRPRPEADRFVARLERLNVRGIQLQRALDVDVDGMGEPGALDVEDEVIAAVLAEEVAAYHQALAYRAAAERHRWIRAAAIDRPIVDIARELGVSRQKVSKIVNSAPPAALASEEGEK